MTFRTIWGNVGRDPETASTSAGEVLRFSLAESIGYEKTDTRWYDVAVFNDGLRERCKKEVYKGAQVAIFGNVKEEEYKGEVRHKVVADRIGLVEQFAGTRRGQKAPESVAATGGYSADL